MKINTVVSAITLMSVLIVACGSDGKGQDGAEQLGGSSVIPYYKQNDLVRLQLNGKVRMRIDSNIGSDKTILRYTNFSTEGYITEEFVCVPYNERTDTARMIYTRKGDTTYVFESREYRKVVVMQVPMGPMHQKIVTFLNDEKLTESESFYNDDYTVSKHVVYPGKNNDYKEKSIMAFRYSESSDVVEVRDGSKVIFTRRIVAKDSLGQPKPRPLEVIMKT